MQWRCAYQPERGVPLGGSSSSPMAALRRNTGADECRPRQAPHSVPYLRSMTAGKVLLLSGPQYPQGGTLEVLWPVGVVAPSCQLLSAPTLLCPSPWRAGPGTHAAPQIKAPTGGNHGVGFSTWTVRPHPGPPHFWPLASRPSMIVCPLPRGTPNSSFRTTTTEPSAQARGCSAPLQGHHPSERKEPPVPALRRQPQPQRPKPGEN